MRGLWFPALLAVVMMLGYLVSFGIFVTRSEDFILVERQARGPKQNLPFLLDLTSSSTRSTTLSDGWSYPENWGTWTIGDEAIARFLIPELKPGLKLQLRIHLDRCFAPSIDHPVALKILIDKKPVMEKTFVSSEAVVLEADHLRRKEGNRLDLKMRIEGASTPLERGFGDDQRVLGFGVSKIEILSIP